MVVVNARGKAQRKRRVASEPGIKFLSAELAANSPG
jgi:hypothetical protein